MKKKKEKEERKKSMKDQIFGVLQRVGRSFMLPIAILPVAGLSESEAPLRTPQRFQPITWRAFSAMGLC